VHAVGVVIDEQLCMHVDATGLTWHRGAAALQPSRSVAYSLWHDLMHALFTQLHVLLDVHAAAVVATHTGPHGPLAPVHWQPGFDEQFDADIDVRHAATHEPLFHMHAPLAAHWSTFVIVPQALAHLPLIVSYTQRGSAEHSSRVWYLAEHFISHVGDSWHAGCCRHVALVSITQDGPQAPVVELNMHCGSALQSPLSG